MGTKPTNKNYQKFLYPFLTKKIVVVNEVGKGFLVNLRLANRQSVIDPEEPSSLGTLC